MQSPPGEARLSGNSSFVDSELNVIDDQWQHLAQTKQLSSRDLSKLLSQLSSNVSLISEQRVTDNRPPWEITAERKYVDDYSPSARVVVANGKYVGVGFDLPRMDTLFLAMPIDFASSRSSTPRTIGSKMATRDGRRLYAALQSAF